MPAVETAGRHEIPGRIERHVRPSVASGQVDGTARVPDRERRSVPVGRRTAASHPRFVAGIVYRDPAAPVHQRQADGVPGGEVVEVVAFGQPAAHGSAPAP